MYSKFGRLKNFRSPKTQSNWLLQQTTTIIINAPSIFVTVKPVNNTIDELLKFLLTDEKGKCGGFL
jgi:hypothetical protein